MKNPDFQLEDLLPVLRKPLPHNTTPEAFRQHQLLSVCAALFCTSGKTVNKADLLNELGAITRENDPESGLETYVAEPLGVWFKRHATELLMSERQHVEAKIVGMLEGMNMQELHAILNDLQQAE